MGKKILLHDHRGLSLAKIKRRNETARERYSIKKLQANLYIQIAKLDQKHFNKNVE